MKYEKFKEFVNDDENGLVVRLGMSFLGIILGSALVLLSLVFDRGGVGAITFLVFGCVIFASFLIATGVWYADSQ